MKRLLIVSLFLLLFAGSVFAWTRMEEDPRKGLMTSSTSWSIFELNGPTAQTAHRREFRAAVVVL